MALRTILLVLVSLFSLLLISCEQSDNNCTDTCGCGEVPDTTFDIQSLTVENRAFDQLSPYSWLPTETIPVNPNETVNALHYLIELRSVTEPPISVAKRKLDAV